MSKPWIVGAASFAGGAVIASGAWTAFPPRAPAAVTKDETRTQARDDDDALRKANATLTDSLHACDPKAPTSLDVNAAGAECSSQAEHRAVEASARASQWPPPNERRRLACAVGRARTKGR